jgi:hypothetical protein
VKDILLSERIFLYLEKLLSTSQLVIGANLNDAISSGVISRFRTEFSLPFITSEIVLILLKPEFLVKTLLNLLSTFSAAIQ